jgi:hypothetical protein
MGGDVSRDHCPRVEGLAPLTDLIIGPLKYDNQASRSFRFNAKFSIE